MAKAFLPICAVLALGFQTACSRDAKPTKAEAVAGVPQQLAVAVTPVTSEDLTNSLELTAEFRPYQEVEVHAKVAGYLKQIFVDVGDRVVQGQLLATLEIPEFADEAEQARATKKRSEAELVRATRDLERAKSAHEASHLSYSRLAAVLKTRPHLVAQQEIDEALARDRVSESLVSSAQASIAVAEQQVDISKSGEQRVTTLSAYARITAPFAGVITKRYADTGAMIQAGTASQSQAMPVVRLSQNSRLRLIVPVPESVAPRIRIGSQVEVRVASLNRTFQGTIARFSGRVQSSTRTMETEVDVANPSMVLMPGMYADAILVIERRHDVLTVPVQAVSAHDTAPAVLIVSSENKIEQRPVKLGLETSDKVEITSGLKSGELVVVGSRGQLKSGQAVTPKTIDAVAKGEK